MTKEINFMITIPYYQFYISPYFLLLEEISYWSSIGISYFHIQKQKHILTDPRTIQIIPKLSQEQSRSIIMQLHAVSVGKFLGGGGVLALSLFFYITACQASFFVRLICSNRCLFYASSVYQELDQTNPSLLIS